jgi:hypothetical protein
MLHGNAAQEEAAETARGKVERERDRLRLILGITNTLISHLDIKQLFPAIATSHRLAGAKYSAQGQRRNGGPICKEKL